MRKCLVFFVFSLFFAFGCSQADTEPGLQIENGPSGLGFGDRFGVSGTPGGAPQITNDAETISTLPNDELDAIVDPVDEDADTVIGFEDVAGQDAFETADVIDTDADSEEPVEKWTIDVSDVECLFIPEYTFNPVLECQWSGSPEFSKHDDVVMTPVVINLTDDDLDGDVDTKDIPDVAFVSYRYQQDGCCNSPSVLRIISGSCNKGTASIGSQNKELDEHMTVGSVLLDNSGGLAVGDVDNDGVNEIYAMKKEEGSILFSGIQYPTMHPDELTAESGWTGTGGGGIVGLLVTADGDTGAASATEPGAELMGKGVFVEEPEALGGVRVRVSARTDGALVKVVGLIRYLADSGEILSFESPPVNLAGEEFQDLRFPFLKNERTGEPRQWVKSDLESLEFGIKIVGDGGGELVVSELALEVASIFIEWESDYPKNKDIVTGAQPSIVDVNQDGIAELLVGRTLIDAFTGLPIWTGEDGTGMNGFIGPISFAADLDLDGTQEVIAGGTLYSSTGETIWEVDYGNEGSGCKEAGLPCDGFNAVGNFDDDPEGEIATVRNGVAYVFQHTGEKTAMRNIPKAGCGKNEGGPPTVADFDNDGEAEIGVAGANYYVVVDWECCVDTLACDAIPPGKEEECEEPGIRWKVANQDCSSRVTGSSVFDFQGDGAAEVIYNDEVKFRIFDGDTGAVLLEVENKSHTRLEYPVIVDSDRDGNAEIVFVENKDDAIPIQIWGDSTDNWVPTRTIWNQHAYHISHINEDGSIPAPGGLVSWLAHNTFRQNLPDFDPFLAPDLQAEWLSVDFAECPEVMTLEGKVCNAGQLWASGIDVRVYQENGAEIVCQDGILMDNTLESGECTQVLCRVENPSDIFFAGGQMILCVDGFDSTCTGPGFINECNEDNNVSSTSMVLCQ